MDIHIHAGIGEGPTKLAAFDKALIDANIANFNLIYLSSVLPRGSVVTTNASQDIEGEWGDRLYVVVSQISTHKPHQKIWAGLGWMQMDDGRGLLVEQEGYTEAEVRSDIQKSLQALAKNRHQTFGPIKMKLASITCEDQPVCALVVATFESAGWSDTSSND